MITYVIVRDDRMVQVSIMNSMGRAPVPGIKMVAVPVAINAPPAVMIMPPMPDADPANWGRTDIIPEVALGRTMPFPTPIKHTQPKNDNGMGVVNKNIPMQSNMPLAVIKVPISIILLTPTATENRPDRPLPRM